MFNLLHSLSPANQPRIHSQSLHDHSQNSPLLGVVGRARAESPDGGLGDFKELWSFLDIHTATEAPRPAVGTFESSTAAARSADRDAYASDGALYYPPSAKGVRWRDEVEEGAELADTQPETQSKVGLTKKQRKKINRKTRREEECKESQDGLVIARASAKSFESDDDLATSPPTPARHAGIHKTLAPKASKSAPSSTPRASAFTTPATSLHQMPSPSRMSRTMTNGQTPSRTLSPTKQARVDDGPVSKRPELGHLLRPSSVAPMSKAPQSASVTETLQSVSKMSTASSSKVFQAGAVQNPAASGSKKHDRPRSTQRKAQSSGRNAMSDMSEDQTNTPLGLNQSSTPIKTGAAPMLPISEPLQGRNKFAAHSAFATPTPNPRRHELLPLAYRNNADRNWTLLLKLLTEFPDDRDSLLSPLQLSINRPQPTGIHVFVDASNILIGFRDRLKRVRGIPAGARIASVDLNFHALALLLERRRPVAKRELVGSTPEIAAYEEAREVGYRVCILDKVYKARELTERQKRYAARAALASAGHHGSASGSEGADAHMDAPQQPKWVEQGVDEILHLKILESVVDTDVAAMQMSAAAPATSHAAVPAKPTIVLATGDAAEAEYSGGFLEMAVRALKRGWWVEVVAWGASVSMGYRRMHSKGEWGPRFRIIQLDDYVEELFGPSAAAALTAA